MIKNDEIMKKKYLLMIALAFVSAVVVAGVQGLPLMSVQEVQETNVVTSVNDATVEDLVKVAPNGWTNAVTNGNFAGDDVSSFIAKEYPSTDMVAATIMEGAGKDGGRGILVKAGDDTENEEAQAWDSQFWIVLPEALPKGALLHVEFDYMASQYALVTTQVHDEPGAYIHWSGLGDVNFTTEWQHFSTNVIVSDEQAGVKSIAFNLAEEKNAIDYHFDNFGVWYQKPSPEKTIYVAADVAPNIYAWVYDEINGTNISLNGEWPGLQVKEQTIINGRRFWKQTINSEYPSFNVIFSNNGNYQTNDIYGISYDSYFTYDGYYGYEDVTQQYAGGVEEDIMDIEQEVINFPSATTRYYYGTDTIQGIKAKVVFNNNGGSDPYNNYGTRRFDANNSVKIVAGEEIISDVLFTMSGSYSMNVNADAGAMEGNHWTGMTNEVTFVNTSGSQTRFTSITITYQMSKEVLFERLTKMVATADSTLATIQYANVPGLAEVVQLVETARTVSLDDENVDKNYLKTINAQLRNSLAAVVALDNEYQMIAENVNTLTELVANNQFVDSKLAAEEENFKAEVLNGLAEGSYSAKDTPALWNTIYDYTTRLAYLHLDIDVPVQGAMGDSILAKVENFTDVQSLRLTGKLNSDDVATLKSRLTSLFDLDLEGLDWTAIPAEQFSGKTNLQRIILPANLKSIGNNAFYNCQNLQPITFPATLQAIGQYAFYQTYNIGDVVLPEGLNSLGSYAFYNSHLTSVNFPSTLRTVSNSCFYNCDYLKEVNFNGQTSIENYAFYYSDGLTNIKFPETLTSIGYEAFANCKNLKNIEFNEGLTNIGDEAFYNCDALESITLPSSLQNMNGYYCFQGCDRLSQVTCNAIVPPYTNNGNITGKSGLDLYVPLLSVNVYKQTSGWDQFNIHGINVMPDNIVVDRDYNLNWPDSLSIDYKPNVYICDWNNEQGRYGSLTVNGNSTLSAGLFSIKYDPNIARNRSYYDAWGSYTYNRYAYCSLVNNAAVRADNVTMELWLQANTWEFITIPFDVKVSDLRENFAGTPLVIRKYDGEKRAAGLTGQTWVDMTADSTLHAGQGYIWRSASTDGNRNYTGFYIDALQTVNKNNIFANGDLEVPLAYYESEFAHNRSWNLIGNPYPCFYDIRAMQTSAPITIWDTYQNNYRAFSPQDDAYILNPGQAFFVQRPVDEESITFLKEGRQTNLTARSQEDFDYAITHRAPAATKAQRSVFNVILSNGNQSDRTRFVINSTATATYEPGRDASKFASLVIVPQIYTIEDGVQFAINERPYADGKVLLGMQIMEEGIYTLKLDTNVDNEVWLIDNLTGQKVLLSNNEEGYAFQSKTGTFESRFMLLIGNGETTGITDNNRESISDNGTVYDMQGRRVDNAQKGVYIKDGRKVLR